MTVIVDRQDSSGAAVRFFAAVDQAGLLSGSDQIRVAFDCEGVNLSRNGSVEIVAICFEAPVEDAGTVFLVDINSEHQHPESVVVLRKLFSNKDITKVIHDSRMDCDALFHLHEGITLVNVHDTSCFHTVETGNENTSLNDCLSHNGVQQNSSRNKNIYKRNPRFWATRPMSLTMIQWSSSDVDKLLVVATRQADKLKLRGSYDKALEKSKEYTTLVRDMEVERYVHLYVPVGRFIGRKGANIRSLERRTGTVIYRDANVGSQETWMIFYKNFDSVVKVKRAMGNNV